MFITLNNVELTDTVVDASDKESSTLETVTVKSSLRSDLRSTGFYSVGNLSMTRS